MRIIDLRSDTVTKPTPEMRRAMADAEVGDDVLDGDPTVRRLEARVCELLGKERALFFPSGTMAQQVALRILCERNGIWTVGFHPQCHLDVHEERGYSHLHGLQERPIGQRDRLVNLDALRDVAEPLGALLLELGKPGPALEGYEAALKMYPARYRALYGAGLAAERMGKADVARDY